MFIAKSSYLEKSVQKTKISRNMTNYTFKPMSYRKNTIEGVNRVKKIWKDLEKSI